MSTFRTSRRMPAPPAAVFAALSHTERLARWWGPSGFTNVVDVSEFRPGGQWVFTMIGPDGQRYANRCTFDAIEPPHRVVIRHQSAPHFTLIITLVAVGNTTDVWWEQAFDDPAVAEAVRAVCVPANEQNLDRLASELGLAGRAAV